MDARAKEESERRWRITIVVALVLAGIAGAIGVATTDSSPKLQYRVEDGILGYIHHVTVMIRNSGDAPSMNLYGWVEFPVGEEPQMAVGHFRFEVQVGQEWKQLGQRGEDGVRRVLLRRSQRRTDIRAKRIQPGFSYELHFYAKRERPVSDSVKVHLADDSGPADHVQSW